MFNFVDNAVYPPVCYLSALCLLSYEFEHCLGLQRSWGKGSSVNRNNTNLRMKINHQLLNSQKKSVRAVLTPYACSLLVLC